MAPMNRRPQLNAAAEFQMSLCVSLEMVLVNLSRFSSHSFNSSTQGILTGPVVDI